MFNSRIHSSILAVLAIFHLMLSQPLMAQHITDTAGGRDPWYSLNGQRGMHFNGKTYFCYQAGDPDWLDPYVMVYDHRSGGVEGPVKVGENPLSRWNDDHGNPGLIVDDKGYIHVIYGGHGQDWGKMRHAVSVRPEDISEWKHLKNIRRYSTYPCLIKLSDGSIFYFYRAGNHRDDWVYVISKDHGRTFSKKHRLMRAGGRRGNKRYYESSYFDSWYGAFFKGQGDTIHYITRYHACADDWRDGYHLKRRVNLYYMRRDPDGIWRNIAGEKLKLPINLTYADEHCCIWKSDPAKGKGKLITIAFSGFDTDKDDNPYVVFGYGPGKLGRYGREYQLAIGDLASGEFTFQPIPSGGVLTVDTPERITILRGRHLRVSEDQGGTWTRKRNVLEIRVERMTPLFNPHPDARVLATEPQPYLDERRIKLYLWGDHGFLTASKKAPISRSPR
jgi:hypothetical protein